MHGVGEHKQPTRFNKHADVHRFTSFNKHADEHHAKPTNTKPMYTEPTKTKHTNTKQTNTTHNSTCQARGSPGWNDLAYIPLGYFYSDSSTTPQECCNECITNQNCFEWYFIPIDSLCYIVTSNPCSNATYSMSCVGLEGGSVRCSGSSNW
ncbi:26837_t:CDS:2 [Dentiscutata erythropus]|uniref:26837_t:CDS:1 n=1 Tax=Dentiscutata erythropus TaxID=1348616 RepID=A0A9N9GZW4_9GLOM|nr:26837_t:CDS:2 [Dentiscutata erythropus]